VTPRTLGPDGKPIRLFRDREAWAAWLEQNHASSSGVWVRLARKASRRRSVSYGDALEVALCYGWIDGQARSGDEDYSLQRFTPRARRSIWSKRNREKALALIEAGKMRCAGLAEVERPRRDGRWAAAYDSPSQIAVPADLQAALEGNERAMQHFETLDNRNRFAILHRLQTAKKPETRARRLAQFITMLENREKPYP
jgi:uncharacterized protein YdeI (YjbR/CyaY-like superfamily)